jgi:hypothetical protein
MPTSLVSTGVQFPDSTIQTTAASASPYVTLLAQTVTSATSQVAVSFNPALYVAYECYVLLPITTANACGLQFSTNAGSTWITSNYVINSDGSGRNCIDVASTGASASFTVWLTTNNTYGGYVAGFRMNNAGSSSGGNWGWAQPTGSINAMRFISGQSNSGGQSGTISSGQFVVIGVKNS